MDKKEIVDVLKEEGLVVAEEMAVNAVRAAFKLIRGVASKVDPDIGFLVTTVLTYAEPKLLTLIDSIDGEDNPDY
jgi:hypothetical protein